MAPERQAGEPPHVVYQRSGKAVSYNLIVRSLLTLAALAPGGLAQACYLCQRLRAEFPALRIVVGRWGCRRDPGKTRQRLLSAGADRVVSTLREARRQAERLIRTPVRVPERSGPVRAPGDA